MWLGSYDIVSADSDCQRAPRSGPNGVSGIRWTGAGAGLNYDSPLSRAGQQKPESRRHQFADV